MDLAGIYDSATSSALLDVLAGEGQVRQASEVREWLAIVAWAERNLWDDESSEKAVEDVVAALDTGARAWRLHRVYASVAAGRLAPWRAARIAELTLHLSADAAAYVDAQLFNATTVGWAQLDRLITEAVIRFDPETAEKERQKAQNNLKVHVSTPTESGQVYLDATLDAADGADLDQALARGAEARKSLGDELSLDERRARALGDTSRRDLALDLLIADTGTGEIVATAPGRVVETVVHITPDSVTGTNPVGRWNDRPVATTQIREWLQSAAKVIVRP